MEKEMTCGWSRTPTTYDDKYCKALVHHCSDGSSLVSFAVFVGVTYQELRNWKKKHPMFAEAYIAAKEAQMCAWEKMAMAQATGLSKGNAASLIFTMKNRFSEFYKDKQEVEMKGDLSFMIDTGIRRAVEDKTTDSVEVDYTVSDSELL